MLRHATVTRASDAHPRYLHHYDMTAVKRSTPHAAVMRCCNRMFCMELSPRMLAYGPRDPIQMQPGKV